MKTCKAYNPYDMLNKENIYKSLNNKHEIEIFDKIDSTNNYLKSCYKNNKKEFHIVIANSQTNGKGRLNRQFYSPSNNGIYFSFLLFPKIPLEDCVFLTTIAAVSVYRAIKKVFSLETQIKWVNDIYCKGKKLCGILTESSFDSIANKLNYAIVGIGINFKKSQFPNDISNIAISLEGCVKITCDKNTLIAEIINNFEELYNKLPNKEFIEEYREKSMLIGKKVTVIQNDISYEAKVLDIDENANLVVNDNNGIEHTLFHGEVSLKI